MGDWASFGLFLSGVALLCVAPGTDTAYLLARTIAQGRRIGVVSALGVITGAGVHVVGAAAGVSAILAASATAFMVVKIAGAFYLIWLGIQALRSKGGISVEQRVGAPEISARRAFWQGVMVDVLNPKVAVFFLAFLPQFVDPALGAAWWQMLTLGGIVLAAGFAWDVMLVLAAERMTAGLRRRPGLARWLDRALGSVLIALGLRLAADR